MARIDEPVIYPHSEAVLNAGIVSLAELKKWRLLDVSWRIKDRRQPEETRYYFGYVGVGKRAMLFGRNVFTGYVLLESHYVGGIDNYSKPNDMWGQYMWAYRGRLSNTRKNELFLNMLWSHWTDKKKKDEKLSFRRNLHNVHLYKDERLMNNQLREIARRVWS
jgi:hypothetical protein